MDELLQFLGRSLFFGESKENIDVGSTGLFTFYQPNLSISASSLGVYYS